MNLLTGMKVCWSRQMVCMTTQLNTTQQLSSNAFEHVFLPGLDSENREMVSDNCSCILQKHRSSIQGCGYRNSMPWSYRVAPSMNLKVDSFSSASKPLSEEQEWVFYCSLSKKLFNIVFFVSFKARLHAVFTVPQPGPKITVQLHRCSMQWAKKSSPYCSSNSSTNWCFHSIPVKVRKSLLQLKNEDKVRLRPSLFGQPSQDNKTLIFQNN